MTRFDYEVLQTDGPLAGTWVHQSFETPSPEIYRDTFTTQIHAGEIRNVREVSETIPGVPENLYGLTVYFDGPTATAVWIEPATAEYREPSLSGCYIADFLAEGPESESAFEISAPESPAFMDRVNAALGSSFRFEDFPGR